MTTTAAAPRVKLEVIQVPDPCPADWSAMAAVDGDRVRFCRHCDQHVYNLSALPRATAERLVAERLSDGRLCVRMLQRADGTVVSADCRGRWRTSVARWAARWGGPAGAVVSVLLAVIGCEASDRAPTTTTGRPSPPLVLTGIVAPTTRPATQPTTRPTPPPLMGKVAAPNG